MVRRLLCPSHCPKNPVKTDMLCPWLLIDLFVSRFAPRSLLWVRTSQPLASINGLVHLNLVKGLFPYNIRPRSCFQSSWGRYIMIHSLSIKDQISEPPIVKRPKFNQEVDWSLFVFHLGEQTWATQKLNPMSLFWWVYKESNNGIPW